MKPVEKFKINRPSKNSLKELGYLVDEIENLHHQGIDISDKLKILNSKLTSPMELYGICSYYGAYSRDEFISLHLTPDAHNHLNLADDELIWLITKIKENIPDDALISYYGEILEINTSSPSGTVSNMIFFDEDRSPKDILKQLKNNRNNVIQL